MKTINYSRLYNFMLIFGLVLHTKEEEYEPAKLFENDDEGEKKKRIKEYGIIHLVSLMCFLTTLMKNVRID